MKIKKLLIAAGVVAVLFGAVKVYRFVWSETLTEVHFVKDGEERCDPNGTGCRFLEYTTDETFENVDEWTFLKFNSADVHRKISKGGVCERVLVAGWRIPFFSSFRNIVWVEGCK
jgi:hypothetical protein